MRALERSILEKLHRLTVARQKEVLEFVKSLSRNSNQPQEERSLYGLWADLGIELSEEDIAEARREAWGNFPRDGF